jgi:hypothetical protein
MSKPQLPILSYGEVFSDIQRCDNTLLNDLGYTPARHMLETQSMSHMG